MNGLLTLQNKFQEHLLNADADIFNDIVATEKVPIDVRLGIYSYAYRSRLLEALATSFPVLQLYLGHEQFETLGNAYLDLYPSRFRSIRWFGDRLESFLKEHTPYANFPYLAELANVEWSMTLVFDAPDSNVVALDVLASVPPESWADMRLLVHPSTRLLLLSWNIVPVWQALSEEESPVELIQSESPITWVFWRKELINYYCSLTDDEAAALDVMMKNGTFGDICEVLCEWIAEEEVAMRAASLLKGWITAGLIADIQY